MTNLERIKKEIAGMTAEEFEEAYGDMLKTCPEAHGQKCQHVDEEDPPCFECSVKWLNEEVDDAKIY